MADWNVLTLRLDEIVVADDRARALKPDDARAIGEGVRHSTMSLGLRPVSLIQKDAEGAIPMIGTALRWDLQVAELLGFGKSTVRNYATVHQRISSPSKASLRSLGLADEIVPLMKFAALQSEDQERTLAILSAGDEATIAGAIAAIEQQDVKREVLSPADKKTMAFLRTTDG